MTPRKKLKAYERTAPAGIEVELKLRAGPGAFGRLRESADLAPVMQREVRTRHLMATYYDTADLNLRSAGLSLRVRREGDKCVQTLKASGTAAGAFRRNEWQTKVPAFRIFPERFDAKALARADIRTLSAAAAVFATNIEREIRVAPFATDGKTALIEIALDRGTIDADGHSLAIAEIELELLEGPPAALYALARAMNDVTPLHVETLTKSDRGYGLIVGDGPAWRKAPRLTFPRSVSVDGAIGQVFRSCYEHWLINEAVALAGADSEGVHQMRVALRRLRTALKVFAGAIPTDQMAWLKSESKWLADSLGMAREWDVFFEGVLDPLDALRPGDSALAALRLPCTAARDAGYDAVRSAIGSHRYTDFVLRFGFWLESAGWRHGDQQAQLNSSLRKLSDSLLAQRNRKALKLGRNLPQANAEQRHDLRLAVKQLRYTAEFFAPLYKTERARAYLKNVSALQETLGLLNDIADTETRLDAIVAANDVPHDRDSLLRATGIAIGWIAERSRNAEAELMDRWMRFSRRQVSWGGSTREKARKRGIDPVSREPDDRSVVGKPAAQDNNRPHPQVSGSAQKS